MKIQTATLSPNLDPHTSYQVYNGLDCCLTFEIFETLENQLRQKSEPHAALIYSFERAMQAPALDIMKRGWRIDQKERESGQALLRVKQSKLTAILNVLASAVWDKSLNANSPAQLKSFFYVHMGLPEQHSIVQGVRRVSTNREALEKLSVYFYAKPLINAILALREVTKKLSVLETEVSRDGRMRTSYNVAGTETGRWNSSASADGSGTNLMNVTEELRRMFVPDPGMKIGHLDKEQAEARVVGLLVYKVCGDSTYLDACESGDLHTTTARLVWPSLNWTGDNAQDREIAEQAFYRHFSYRDMSKRGGHLTNYFGKPPMMGRHLKIPVQTAINFQDSYFKAFPGIREWHEWVRRELAKSQSLTTLLGRSRTFYGRPGDDATLREAIAFEPQSVIGDMVNLIIWLIWKHERRAQLLGQTYDSIDLQYPDNPEAEASILTHCLKLAEIPLTARDRTIIIPTECSTGYNWSKHDPKCRIHKDGNPRGLKKWRGSGAIS